MDKNNPKYLVQKIRTQYTEKEYTELDALKDLDKKVKAPANTLAYIFGSVSALIMGAGMSLIMTDIGQAVGFTDSQVPGLVIGIVGMVLVIVNYPIYKKFLNHRRKRYAEQIITLSNKLMNH